MCRNDKNIFKATAIFVVALIVFGFMNYHHTITHSKIGINIIIYCLFLYAKKRDIDIN